MLEGTKVWRFVLEKDPFLLHAVFSKDLFGDGVDPVVLERAGILVETIEISKGEGIVVPSNLPHCVENKGSPWCLAMAYSFLPLTLLEASRQAFEYWRWMADGDLSERKLTSKHHQNIRPHLRP